MESSYLNGEVKESVYRLSSVNRTGKVVAPVLK